MSTAPEAKAEIQVPIPPPQREIRIYSHSALFYWWPVWAVGFLMAIITWVGGDVMAVVSRGSKAEQKRTVDGFDGKRDVVVLPQGKDLPKDSAGNVAEPYLHVAQNGKLGVIWASVLMVIIVITNVPLRGLWSLLILLFIVFLVVLFALLEWWTWILEKLNLIDIRINTGGYMFISGILLIIWAVTVFVFDHRHYLIVTSGQVRVCLAIGTGETVYDTTGMTFSKRQDDLFRHWIVGLGSGDLVIHRPNAPQDIDMPNVLFIGSKIREIETLIKEREVV